MGSIPKIVSTPLKWASKKVLNSTLLRFPGGDPHSPVACVYCPEMCRFSCPTAVVSGNDAVTPCNKMGLLYKEEKWPGQASEGNPLWPIYDCTGCGRCTEYCVYKMPVTDRLFEARKEWKWPLAEKVAADLTDYEDPIGDLADELGDEASAKRRLQNFIHLNKGTGRVAFTVQEPKSLVFLQKSGHKGCLSLDSFLSRAEFSADVLRALLGKTWLFHESVWFSRHLNRWQDVQGWLEKARDAGIELKRPFAQGLDCIDCGGEGAYPKLFAAQARQMAVEYWERDQHRADGILCLSLRCAEHFRSSLNSNIPVVAIEELAQMTC